MLETATCAPSAHNRQPWRFGVLKNYAAKQRLAVAMGEQLRFDRTRDGDRSDAIEQDVARSIARITGAPIVVVVCLTMEDMDRYPDDAHHCFVRMLFKQQSTFRLIGTRKRLLR